MKYIFKIFILSALIGLFFTSCEKDESLTSQKPSKFSTAKRVDEIKLNQIEFSKEKETVFAEKQVFLDGGMVMINGQVFTTKIVGDQRWITIDYTKYTGGQAFTNGGTTHHSYDAAMSINNSPTQMNFYAPPNLVEHSGWRIPSWDDMNHLHHMVYGDEASIITGLNMQATGMIQWDGTGTPADNSVWVNQNQSIFWCADFSLGDQGQDTWHLFANDAPNQVVLFQYQIHYPYAPIRLVQDVTPIQ